MGHSVVGLGGSLVCQESVTLADYTETQQRWQKEYPDQPFETLFALPMSSQNFAEALYSHLNPLPTEQRPKCPAAETQGLATASLLQASVPRQVAFIYQVSQSHFHDNAFLSSAVRRYYNFLMLKRQSPKVQSTLSVAADLYWV